MGDLEPTKSALCLTVPSKVDISEVESADKSTQESPESGGAKESGKQEVESFSKTTRSIKEVVKDQANSFVSEASKESL